jgi:hypothetical protein
VQFGSDGNTRGSSLNRGHSKTPSAASRSAQTLEQGWWPSTVCWKASRRQPRSEPRCCGLSVTVPRRPRLRHTAQGRLVRAPRLLVRWFVCFQVVCFVRAAASSACVRRRCPSSLPASMADLLGALARCYGSVRRVACTGVAQRVEAMEQALLWLGVEAEGVVVQHVEGAAGTRCVAAPWYSHGIAMV